MKVNVSGRNINVTDSLKDYAEKKVGKIAKYLDGEVDAQVTMSVEKDRHIVEVTMPVNGMILRGETETHDMYTSIDLVADKLEKQLEKYKTKLSRSVRKGFKANGSAEKAVVREESKVVKTKRFALKPMDQDEAIMQMELLGHDFFVFTNAQTQLVNVIYKRRDGNYGLIEPDML